MSFGIAGGWSGAASYVSATAYGDRDGGPPSPEDIGKAYGGIRRAADAALDFDPDATFRLRVQRRPAEPRDAASMYRATFHIELSCYASSYDVLVGGPMWRRRASEVARRMREALDQAIPLRVVR